MPPDRRTNQVGSSECAGNGKILGRPPLRKLTDTGIANLRRERKHGKVTFRLLAKTFGSRSGQLTDCAQEESTKEGRITSRAYSESAPLRQVLNHLQFFILPPRFTGFKSVVLIVIDFPMDRELRNHLLRRAHRNDVPSFEDDGLELPFKGALTCHLQFGVDIFILDLL